MRSHLGRLAVATLLVVVTSGCTGDEAASSGAVRVVVSTSVLGDVVTELVGDEAEVMVLMPRNTDPHGFQPSAKQIAAVVDADALIVNGGGFEEGLDDSLRSAAADGVPVFAAIDAVDVLPLADGDPDPHFFTDPARMAEAAEGILAFLSEEVPQLAPGESATDYIDQLRGLDAEVEAVLSAVPTTDRFLVTNHEVLHYFADRYDFEVIGSVVPGGSTSDGVSARDLEELSRTLRDVGVAVVFAETSAPAELAETLAAEVGSGVEVVELYTESLGAPGTDGGTYVDMIRTNARRIAAALTRERP